MAATLTQDCFFGRDWLFERKFDGIRILAYKRGDAVRLYSRNRLPRNLPAVQEAIAELAVDEVILDGASIASRMKRRGTWPGARVGKESLPNGEARRTNTAARSTGSR
jgi:ATP-dependent DNA ligase